MKQLFIHIANLVNTREGNERLHGAALSQLPCIQDAYLLIEDERIADFGPMYELELNHPNLPPGITDLTGKTVLPAWCDSHTHLVFAGSRENEFVDKIKGKSYATIAAAGGGILRSAEQIAAISDDELFAAAKERLAELARLGTGAIEIKSGYGLSLEGELKMLRVIKRLKAEAAQEIKATFLGAHSYPPEFKTNHCAYLDLLLQEMLPAIAEEGLADFIDVFCEDGFFSPAETEQVCAAAHRYGLRPKLHVNQLNSIGGIQAGLRQQALSLDHLETLLPADIDALRSSYQHDGMYNGPVCTLLPTAAFFLRMTMPPARQLIDAGCALAIASDLNPGSSPSGNMNLVIAMSCIQMRLLPEEAINAATLNGAYAMALEDKVGSITRGKLANFIITKPIPSLAYLPYAFGETHIDKVMLRGKYVQ